MPRMGSSANESMMEPTAHANVMRGGMKPISRKLNLPRATPTTRTLPPKK